MKILRVFAQNVWGIEELDLKPEGKSLAVTGGNRRGKSSVLKAIQSGVFGPVEGTIHEGAKEGRILIELEEVTIDRIISEDSKTKRLEVTKGDVRVKAPQGFLDKLARALSFNPVQFYLEKPRQQRDLLLKAIPMRLTKDQLFEMAQELTGGELERETLEDTINVVQPQWDRHPLAIAAELYKTFYDSRTMLGQKIEAKKEVVKGLSSIAPADYDAAEHEQKKGELRTAEAQFAKSGEIKREMQLLEEHAEQLRKRAEGIAEQIKLLEKQLDDVRRERTAATERREQKEEDLRQLTESMPSESDLELLRIEVNQHEDDRRRVELRQETEQQAKRAEAEIDNLELKREQLNLACDFFKDELPHAMIEASDLPVEGLAVDDDGITINGKPMDTLSGAERMQLAIKIAEAQLDSDSAMKFVLLDGVEQLDGETFGILEDRAKRGDIQFIWTKVTAGPLKTEQV